MLFMKLVKYISKKNVARLVFFAAVICIAGLFDMYYEREASFFPEDIQELPDTKDVEPESAYLYNSTQTFNLKIAAQKLSSKQLFGCTLSKFVQHHHNTKAFQLLKTKSLKTQLPMMLLSHFFIFQRHYYSSPDDDYLLA